MRGCAVLMLAACTGAAAGEPKAASPGPKAATRSDSTDENAARPGANAGAKGDANAGPNSPGTDGAKPGACASGAIALYVTTEGVWLGTGAESRCFDRRRGGALGTVWLREELQAFGKMACRPSVELASAAGVTYQDLIAVMDVAITVGLADVGLSTPKELVVSFANADPRNAAHHCAVTTVARPDTGDAADARGARSARDVVPPATQLDKTALQQAPVVIITLDEISLAGVRVVGVAETARGTGTIDALDRALPHKPADPTLILQADRATDMAVISRVVETVRAAGYTNVLFAVKKK
jgi:biopolymer transport protein ExbD